MVWMPIATVTADDTPFMAWVDPVDRPEWGSIVQECNLDTTGQVVDADGDPIENVTHWRSC